MPAGSCAGSRSREAGSVVPIEIESRRAHAAAIPASPSAASRTRRPLLRLLGKTEAASRVNGQISWTGTAQRLDDGKTGDAWQVSLASTLTGVESRLPEPFDKPAARALPVSAQLRVDADGIQEFEIESGRDMTIRGAVENGITTAQLRGAGRDG